MKAMILAAGLGTRLFPLTRFRPKALVPIVNKPIIGRTIEYLKGHGVSKIIVNAHHHHGQLLDYLGGGKAFGLEIEARVEPVILGTGGGIKNTEDFWHGESFLVINGDILTNIDLNDVRKFHQDSGALVTLVLHDREPFNQVKMENDHRISDIGHGNMPDRLAFTGIHIINPRALKHIPRDQFSDIITCYRDLIALREPIKAYVAQGHYWFDVGTIASYVEANRKLLKEPFAIAHDCYVGPGVKFEEWAIVGARSHLEKDVEIRRSILWEEVSVEQGVRIEDSIVTSSQAVARDLVGKIL